ncbi:MAG: CoxG family protein [Dichotomicrobium sp.]
MKMSGSHTLPAPREEVWEKLNDPDVLRRCIPGCESLEKHDEDKLAAIVNVKIGPMNTRFNGEVQLTNLNPPESYRIEGSGSGGQAGSASGGADVRLEDKGDETELTYDVDARVSGKIAQLGNRLIDATAHNLATKFFENFANEIERPGAEPVHTSAVSVPNWVWIVAVLVVAAVILFFAIG